MANKRFSGIINLINVKGKQSAAAKQAFKDMLEDEITLIEIGFISSYLYCPSGKKTHMILSEENVCLL